MSASIPARVASRSSCGVERRSSIPDAGCAIRGAGGSRSGAIKGATALRWGGVCAGRGGEGVELESDEVVL